MKSFTVRLVVNNVFRKEPPFPALAAGTGGNFASATSLYFPADHRAHVPAVSQLSFLKALQLAGDLSSVFRVRLREMLQLSVDDVR